jgi:thioredoxin-dependent peroxiredoxin
VVDLAGFDRQTLLIVARTPVLSGVHAHHSRALAHRRTSLMIKEGNKAPTFTLPNADGETLSLKDLVGKIVVLYFYPKDSTPGCTLEACDFRDNFARLTAAGAVVLGISADSDASHRKFRDKYQLPFELLADVDRKVIQLYDVWREKNMYGKTLMGIQRSTFVVDAKGILVKEFRGVKVKGHVDEVLDVVSRLK